MAEPEHDAVVDRRHPEAPRGPLLPAFRYGLEDRPGPLATVLYALQHVMIMFTATIAAPLIIGQALDLPAALRGALLTGVLLGAGIGTLASSLGLSGIGGRLPLLLGAYIVYAGPVVAIAKTQSAGAATAAMLIGSALLLVASPLIGGLRRLFPPVVVGTLLVVTGQTILKLAVGASLGVSTPYYGKPLTAYFLLGSIALIVAFNAFFKGPAKSLSVLLALACVYAAAVLAGIADDQPVRAAAWIQMPSLLPFGLAWPGLTAISLVLIYQIVAAVYTMSITLALCPMVGVGVHEQGWRVRGAIAADGFGSVVAVLFGGVPLISYDQNVGAISLTGVASRSVTAAAGAILVGLAFLPKLGSLIRIVPFFVFGGTLVFMFGMIVVVGVRILADSSRTPRDGLILAAAIGLSATVNYAPPQVFEILPQALRILASDGIVVGTIVAVVLNAILPYPTVSQTAVPLERDQLAS